MPSPSLDWTFSPAPSADDPAPNLPPRRPRPNPAAALRLSRRTWLLLGAVAVLALVVTIALPRFEDARTQQALEQVVATQETARLADDWDTLGASYAHDNAGWGLTHALRWQHGWLPMPIGLPGLRADGQPGRVVDFGVVGPQLARVDVERGFRLADGERATFAMPQFYQFVDGAWRQAPPPALTGDDALHLHGQRVDLTFYPADAAFADVLAGELDNLLARTCADWGCPPELHVAVDFDASDPASAASPLPFDDLLGSLALQVLLGRPSAYPNSGVNLATRVAGGYPTNPAASRAVLHAAGVQALISVSQQLAPNTLLHGENVYLDAMIAREAARVDVDLPGVRQAQMANPLYAPAELWSVPLLQGSSADALPEALVVLNHTLADRSPADEQALMQAFNSAPDAAGWLAAAGLAPADIQARLAEALDTPFPTVQWPDFAPDLALSCPSGPVLATLAGQSAPLLAGEFPGSSLDSWSPDGQNLALAVSGRRGVVINVRAGIVGRFLPQPVLPSFPRLYGLSWASNSVLLYPPYRAYRLTGTLPIAGTGLAFLDPFGAGTVGEVAHFDQYLRSPDSAWAAVVGQPSGQDSALAIIPALGGPPALAATAGFNPAWSADSRQVAFAVREGQVVSLAVFDLDSGEQHIILPGDSPALPPTTPAPADIGLSSLSAAWSPVGNQLAVASVTGNGQVLSGWVGMLRPDGIGFHLLAPPHAGLTPDTPAYSGDGAFLAVGELDGAGPAGVALYDAQGALLRWLPGYQAGPWSPAGHTLTLIGLDGVSLLRLPAATPQAVGPAGCDEAAWRP